MLETFLKTIDIYKVDKKLNVTDEKSQTSSSFITSDKLGSKVGGSFSMLLYGIILYQCVS